MGQDHAAYISELARSSLRQGAFRKGLSSGFTSGALIQRRGREACEWHAAYEIRRYAHALKKGTWSAKALQVANERDALCRLDMQSSSNRFSHGCS